MMAIDQPPAGPPSWHTGSNARLDATIDHPKARELVGEYFDPSGPFAGETFVTLGEGKVHPNKFEPEDLLAVTLLDVYIRPTAVRLMLGRDSGRLSEMLGAIEDDVDLWAASVETIEAANDLFARLRYRTGAHRMEDWGHYKFVDQVTAGKLLARKRQRLIPVVDKTVKRALGIPAGRYWEAFQRALSDEERRNKVEGLRPAALDPRVPLLRVLDSAIWMQHSRSTNARAARQKVGL